MQVCVRRSDKLCSCEKTETSIHHTYKNSSSVYIHCLVFLCRKDSKYERCTSGCPGNKIRSRKTRDSPTLTDDGSVAYTGFLKLDSGRILLADNSDPSIKEKGGEYWQCIVATLLKLHLKLQVALFWYWDLDRSESIPALELTCQIWRWNAPLRWTRGIWNENVILTWNGALIRRQRIEVKIQYSDENF